MLINLTLPSRCQLPTPSNWPSSPEWTLLLSNVLMVMVSQDTLNSCSHHQLIGRGKLFPCKQAQRHFQGGQVLLDCIAFSSVGCQLLKKDTFLRKIVLSMSTYSMSRMTQRLGSPIFLLTDQIQGRRLPQPLLLPYHHDWSLETVHIQSSILAC